MSLSNYLTDRKFSILFSILIVFLVSFFYFYYITFSLDNSIYQNMQLKTAYTSEGSLKVFALAENNLLSNVPSVEGNSIPESGGIVIGFSEAEMMKEEKLFSKPGDKLTDFFGIDVSVVGVLRKTDSFLDDFHFLGKHDFDELIGQEDILFVRFKDKDEPKLFYYLNYSEISNISLSFSEGGKEYYNNKTIVLDGVYFPIIIGSKEAEMMKEEKLFSKPGDLIQGFFGKNVVVAGVLNKTGTALDMAHIIPLGSEEFDK